MNFYGGGKTKKLDTETVDCVLELTCVCFLTAMLSLEIFSHFFIISHSLYGGGLLSGLCRSFVHNTAYLEV